MQIIKIALHYEGLPTADGDILRRAINDKGRSKAALQKVKDNYFACCVQKGHPVKLLHSFYQNNEPSSKNYIL